MKNLNLILMRHGEATHSATSDSERTLTEHGRQRSSQVGRTLRIKLGTADVALISSAVRTHETGKAVLSYFEATRFISKRQLYECNSTHEFVTALTSDISHTDQTVLVIGHNPQISLVASELSGQTFRFSPAEYVILTIECDDWNTALELQGCWQVT